MIMRDSTVHRRTKETDVTVTLELDGTGEADIDTGVGFLNHMLTLFAVHGHFDLTVRATGDLDVDCRPYGGRCGPGRWARPCAKLG